MCHRNSVVINILKVYPSTISTFFKNVTRFISVQRSPCLKSVTIHSMNSAIIKMEYAVRGPIMTRMAEIENELKAGVKKPFDRVTRANLGDCHAMGQKPITFTRQVLALVSFPKLLSDPSFPEDVKIKAKSILSSCRGGSVGAYTESPGLDIIRKHCAQFIEARDGIPADSENIFLFDGASNAIKAVLKILNESVEDKRPGVMIPIPQYPLYSAVIAEFNMEEVGYYLDEDKGWSLEVDELERAYEDSKKKCLPRAIVVINPGNPTGQLLSKKNVESVIRFAHKHDLFVFADEVYQANIYDSESEFQSFKKISTQMGPPYNEVELASFMSASKGYTGECGLRGGYVEIVNVETEVKKMMIKCISAMLCSNVLGQTVIDCLVDHPKPGDPSFDRFQTEKNTILKSLALRAKSITESFNSFPNMSSQKVEGALYAFPRITMPDKAISTANSSGISACTMYCFELLEETGICIVPGSGFNQQPGTYHFRTTILPQPDDLKVMLEKMKEFHLKFLERYS